jgi:polyferredoxin
VRVVALLLVTLVGSLGLYFLAGADAASAGIGIAAVLGLTALLGSGRRPNSAGAGERVGSEVPSRSSDRTPAVKGMGAVLLLVLVDDLLLARFTLLGSGAGSFGSLPTPLNLLVGSVLSPAFLVTGVLEALLLIGFLTPRVDLRLRFLLGLEVALVALTPITLPYSAWAPLSSYLGSALIVIGFVTALQFLYRTKQLSPGLYRFLLAWTFAALATAAGWFLWQFEGSPVLLAVGVLVQLAVVLDTTLGSRFQTGGDRVPWLLRPFWVFEFLLFVFLGEFFLGALLDLEVAGRGFLQFIPFVPPSGTPLDVAGVLVYNGLWFASAILASAWFLIALGFTMGPLVIFKMREAHERAQKYRLGLTVAVYGLAAVYIPSFASSTPLPGLPYLQSLPVIGWGFGLRDGGPFESGLFLAVILMYASVGILTVLFGRKALCSVMCGAALMYQGTAMSEMRQFNQSSKIGRHFLGSQLSTAYVALSGVALVSLFGVSVLSYLHLLPMVQVANGELDSATLPLPIMLYFGGVWFAMFVTVPFVGTYNCATTGFCHWGALSIPFAKIGFFKLKVKDRRVCQECTTFDCAKSCPVGLVDMPLAFRTTGEYRSTKCCGVGDCAEACPYGNLYHQDVRFWLRRRVTGRKPSPHAPTPRGTLLPMLPRSPGVSVGGRDAPAPRVNPVRP